MKRRNLKGIAFLVFTLCLSRVAISQSLPVGTPILEDHYRRAQLTSKLDSSISFTIRPLIGVGGKSLQEMNFPDSEDLHNNFLKVPETVNWVGAKGFTRLLPVELRARLNTDHPYGWNDGPMIPAKGLQTVLSAGIYSEFGPLSVQLKPEFVFAANGDFEGFAKDHYEVIWARYYDHYNYTDLPERFGKDSYSQIFWGQSSLRLNFDPVSFGISAENLWWGPGKRNSLLMSNTAPGFKHFTINTARPVQTPLGSVEGQLVAGRLEGSGFDPLTPGLDYFGSPLTLQKPADWRYFSGLAFTWQPKWVPGLFLGHTRSTQNYSKAMGNDIGDYLPLFSAAKKAEADPGANQKDEYSSLFMRWVWFEEQAELYFEYGRNNHLNSRRNTLLEPEDSRAYLVGLTKVFNVNGRPGENIEANLEVTQLQGTSVRTVLNADSWYLSKNITHGYTNKGEVLGAGVGPGGSLQSLDVSWIKGLKRFGLQLERFVHNNDFYYYAYIDSQDWRRHYVDLSLAGKGEWSYKNFLFYSNVKAIKSLNYQWYLLQTDPSQYFTNGRDKLNFSVDLGLTYRF